MKPFRSEGAMKHVHAHLLPFIAFLSLVFLRDMCAGQHGSLQRKLTDVSVIPSEFSWTTGPPILDPGQLGVDEWIAFKDPSIVRHDGQWHLFGTLRGKTRSHALIYTSFSDFDKVHQATPVVLPNHDGYAAAPQVFFFTPHDTWYCICQASHDDWNPRGQAAFATTETIADPQSWSPLKPMGLARTEDKYNLDYWVICDGPTAWIFWTSDNGKMWRAQTAKDDFPYGWSEPVVAFSGDIFEASHIYRADGGDYFFNVIEARKGGDRRYFKILYAPELGGEWSSPPEGFAGVYASDETVTQTPEKWTDYISHGEVVRSTNDEHLRADPLADFIFQGVLHSERSGKSYGSIPWKLGLLKSTRETLTLSRTQRSGIPAARRLRAASYELFFSREDFRPKLIHHGTHGTPLQWHDVSGRAIGGRRPAP